MTSYRRFIQLRPLTSDATYAAPFASLVFDRPRTEAEKRQQAALVDWEAEGGSLVAPDGGRRRRKFAVAGVPRRFFARHALGRRAERAPVLMPAYR